MNDDKTDYYHRSKDYVGQEVTIGVWWPTNQVKEKLLSCNCVTGLPFFQGVAFKPNFIEKFGEEVGLEKFDTIKRLSQRNISVCDWYCQRRRAF